MSAVQDIYATTIRHLPSSEQLHLAAIILNELTRVEESARVRRYAIDLLDELPGGRLFKTSAEADEYLRGERESWDR
jgi:hypothetical protein